MTAQNHGFAVAPSDAREATYVSLYDDTVEGLEFPLDHARSGLSILHRSDTLTILNVVWGPGMQLPAHDHRMWAAIGRLVAKRLTGFDCEILAHDPAYAGGDVAEAVPLADLLARSAVVSLHAPLLPATRHVIGAAERQMVDLR